MKALHGVAFWLAVIGGVNWGLVGIGSFLGGNWDLVYLLIGSWMPALANVVYILVGASAVYLVVTHKRDCKCCDSTAPAGQLQM